MRLACLSWSANEERDLTSRNTSYLEAETAVFVYYYAYYETTHEMDIVKKLKGKADTSKRFHRLLLHSRSLVISFAAVF